MPLPPLPTDQCTYDATGLPLPVQPLDASFTCRPDPARKVECSPKIELVIPVKLGPRTRLYDIAFTGARNFAEKDLADAAQVPLGEPVSTTKLDDARRRVLDAYKEQGYAYADVKYALEPSLDNTRARVRFDIIEGDQVFVRAIVIRGLDATHENVVRRRIALKAGEPYRESRRRLTQERISTLGVFSSVTVSLADPYVPQASKVVIVDVVERLPQYLEVRPGFSTGEGVRGTLEYGHRNLFGEAISVTFRAQLSYLPDPFIVDPQVRQNFDQLDDRLARRITLTAVFPELGLGPLVRSQADLVYVRDLERDFAITKGSAVGSIIWRPVRQVQLAVGNSLELNDVRVFSGQTVGDYLASLALSGQSSADLSRLLRIPDGESGVVAQRAVLTWDRRDNSFNAHKGTFFASSVEYVNAYPIGPPITTGCVDPATGQTKTTVHAQAEGHFVHLTQTFAGYIPITKAVTLAAQLRVGNNVQLAGSSQTYPDRLFFLGGFDSMRGWLQDTFVPQEYADKIAADANKPDPTPPPPGQCPTSTKFTINDVGVRGGNLMINPRFELRFPLRPPLDTVLFADLGNSWIDPSYIYDKSISLRAAVGSGIRLQTPVGPLVFDYGINVTRRFYEDFGAFHFAIGLF
jgi:outer membrane protein assembly factor BamA